MFVDELFRNLSVLIVHSMAERMSLVVLELHWLLNEVVRKESVHELTNHDEEYLLL